MQFHFKIHIIYVIIWMYLNITTIPIGVQYMVHSVQGRRCARPEDGGRPVTDGRGEGGHLPGHCKDNLLALPFWTGVVTLIYRGRNIKNSFSH